ncbi:MAG TPA: ribonuclease HI [Clostridiales bacterium]|jgi:ribonuclease HI|nr:ribonuclease HI [Clostridiales bacterium]
MQKRKKVTIYTDGACSGNPGPGGYGVILQYGEFEKEISGGEPETTNNRMELMGVITGLSALKEPCDVTLYTDSQYIVNGMNQGWAEKWQKNGWMRNKKEPALNPDLWERLLTLCKTHRVTFHWVKGHADNPYNNRCDALAVAAAQKYKSR